MNFEKLKGFVENLDQFGLKECDLSIYKDYKEIYRYTDGYADVECTKPIDKNSLRWMFSMTKVITVVAAMRLVERGLLGLDDPVSEYIPEYANLKVNNNGVVADAATVMTVRHLFSMRSGLTYDMDRPEVDEAVREGRDTTLDIVKEFVKKPLECNPGERFYYGLSHDVLAAVCEIVTGKKWSDYLREEIFEPLGMKNVGFHPTEEQMKLFTRMYTFDEGLYDTVIRKTENELCFSDNYESGGAGLFSTLDDYMKFAAAMANNGVSKDGYVVLKPETIKLLCENQQGDELVYNNGLYWGYGLGVRVPTDMDKLRSRGSVTEYGWDGAASSYVCIDTENNIAIVFCTHIRDTGFFNMMSARYIKNMVYDAIFRDGKKKKGD